MPSCTAVNRAFINSGWREWNVRFGVGLSNSEMKVDFVKTDAPVASSVEGYRTEFPNSFAPQISLQRTWNVETLNLASELGYGATGFNSAGSFFEAFFAIFLRL